MKQYGFDKPAHERYFKMLADFARFDLGRSFMQNKGVWELIKEKLPVSMSLGLWTFLISYAMIHTAGRGQGGARGHALRRASRPSVCCWAMPFRASCWASC
jgi:ABC-type microcin C transport system permease subunit YejB